MEHTSENIYELIEDFLTGSLPEPAAENVRRRIAADPAFAAEVDWMKSMLGMSERKKEVQILEGFSHYRRQRRLRIRAMQAVASLAAAAMLVLCCWQIFFREKPPGDNQPVATEKEPALQISPQHATTDEPAKGSESVENPPSPALIEKQKQSPVQNKPPKNQSNLTAIDWKRYIEPNPDVQTLGTDDKEDEALKKALQLLDVQKRIEALPHLEKYLAGLPPDDDDFEFRIEAAKIYLENKQFEKAEGHLKKVLESDAKALFKVQAQFYDALRNLALGNISSAKTNLKTVGDAAYEPWNWQAKEILASLPTSGQQ